MLVALSSALASFAFTVIAAPLVRRVALRLGIVRKPGGRHRHHGPTPLFGGVAVISAIALVVAAHPILAHTPDILALLGGLIVIGIVGIADDRAALSWPLLLSAQLTAAGFLLLGGVRLSSVNGIAGGAIPLDQIEVSLPDQLCSNPPCALPILGSLIVVLWVISVMNAFNWIDGADGVAAVVALPTFAAIGAIAMRPEVNQPPIAILASIGFGAMLGFLPFNRPPARLFLGSSGSFGIGFLLAALAVLAGAKLATVGMVLLLPAADAFTVLLDRLRRRAPLTEGDTSHLHHLLRSAGVPPWFVIALYFLVSSAFGLAALILERPWKLGVLAFGFLGLTVALSILRSSFARRNNPVGQ